MDGFEWNKVFASILVVLLIVSVLGSVVDALYYPDFPEEMGYNIEVPEDSSVVLVAANDDSVKILDLTMLNTGDMAKGETIFNRKCAVCHTVSKGGANKTGPNLWGIVGAHRASVPGATYSKSAQKGVNEIWRFEDLYAYLYKPRDFVKNTTMSFAGLKKEKDRVDLILYLNSMSDNSLRY